MRTASTLFQRTVRESHDPVVKVEVLDYRGIIDPITQSPTVVELDGVVDGSVVLDQTTATRGRLDLTLADPSLVPTSATDLLAPYGNEIRIRRGVAYANGTEELVSLGVFRIEEAVTEDTPTGTTTRIVGLDRSTKIIEARFESPFMIAAATNYIEAIETVLRTADPGVQTDFPTTDLVTPLLVAEEGGDRWAFAQDMATSLGMRLFFNGDGVCVLLPVSNGLTPLLTLDEGEEGEGGVLVTAARGMRRQGAYNRVIATGENTGEAAPARGVATDEGVSSPTRYGGPYGRVPYFYTSPFLTTDAQALAAAQSILAKQLGSTQTVDFGAIVNPTLEPDDTVLIRREVLGLDESHVLDRVTIPLAATTGVMTCATRAVGGIA